MDGGIVRNDKGVLTHTEREGIRKVHYPVCVYTLRCAETLIMVLAVNHSEQVLGKSAARWTAAITLVKFA
jgi:hypothetical protein